MLLQRRERSNVPIPDITETATLYNKAAQRLDGKGQACRQ